ncbi:hypothetical protein D3C85_1802820 [compost metagenome]
MAFTGCSKVVPIDMIITENVVEIAKVFPICLYPSKTKGKFSRTRKIPRGKPDT